MKCKVYSWIFGFLPVVRWKSALIEKHFQFCEHCRKKLAPDTEIKKTLVRAEDLLKIPDLWPDIWKSIGFPAKKQKSVFKKMRLFLLPGFRWTAIAVAFTGFVLLISILLFKPESSQDRRETSKKIFVKSIKLNDHPAKTFFFQSSEPNRLIIWVKEKQ